MNLSTALLISETKQVGISHETQASGYTWQLKYASARRLPDCCITHEDWSSSPNPSWDLGFLNIYDNANMADVSAFCQCYFPFQILEGINDKKH